MRTPTGRRDADMVMSDIDNLDVRLQDTPSNSSNVRPEIDVSRLQKRSDAMANALQGMEFQRDRGARQINAVGGQPWVRPNNGALPAPPTQRLRSTSGPPRVQE